MNKETFFKTINALRLANPNKWYWFNELVEDKEIQIKGFGTWLQIFNVNGTNYSNAMHGKIALFKKDLQKAFNE